MTLPKVDIQFKSGQLGRVVDPGAGVPAMIVSMAVAPASHDFGKAVLYGDFQNLPPELKAVEAVKLFFAEAPGQKVYIMPVEDTVPVEDIVNPIAATPYALNLANASNDITFIGIANIALDGTALTVQPAATNATALRSNLAAKFRYIRTFIATQYSADLPDFSGGSHEGVGFLISPKGDEMGLLLGRRSKIRVQRNIGRVKDGALAIASSEFETGNKVEDAMLSIEKAHDKKYIALRSYVGKTGYYFTDDPLATTGDYGNDTDRAVADKAASICYKTYVNEINNDVAIDPDGSIASTEAKELQATIENAINRIMTANDEISYVKVFVDDTQNIVSTNKIEISLAIGKKGYLKEIIVKLGFDAPTV